MIKNYVAVFDFETGSLDTDEKCTPIEIACVILDPQKLEIVPDSEFNSLIHPGDFNMLQEAAMKKNRISLDALKEAPSRKVVFNNFAHYLDKYLVGTGPWAKPIAGGYNIHSFDIPIIQSVARQLNMVDKDGNQTFFRRTPKVDLYDLFFPWFHNDNTIANMQLDTLRERFNIPKDGSHRALKDVTDTADLICRLLRLTRKLSASVPVFRTNADVEELERRGKLANA